LLIALAALLAQACSSTPKSSPQVGSNERSAAVTPNFSTHKNDRDNDGDHNNDDDKVLYYGRAANPSERATAVALITNYFSAAAAEDGAADCPRLTPLIKETVVEQDGHSAELAGSTCGAVLTKLFAQKHKLLLEKHATLRVLEVRVKGTKALAVLDFPTIPEVRQISLRRMDGGWRLLDLLDGIIE
jgi:hypothetical protein